MVRPDGSVEEKSYDEAGHLISAKETVDGVVLSQYNYRYDEWGNLEEITNLSEKDDYSEISVADREYSLSRVPEIQWHNKNIVTYEEKITADMIQIDIHIHILKIIYYYSYRLLYEKNRKEADIDLL